MQGITEAQREHLTALIGFLDRDGLLELRGVVDDTLAELESHVVENCPGGQEAPAGSRGGSKGYVELKCIRGFGPYAYLRWREGGRLRSAYLGKVEQSS